MGTGDGEGGREGSAGEGHGVGGGERWFARGVQRRQEPRGPRTRPANQAAAAARREPAQK